MSGLSNQQSSCVRHNYDAKNLIPMDLNTTASRLRDAIDEIHQLTANLKSCNHLESDEADEGPSSKKRKLEKEKLPTGISAQVDKALHNIGHRKESGQCSLHSLIDKHESEWNRKWGTPNGVYRDLLRVYPERRFEIIRDQNKHDTVFNLVDGFWSAHILLCYEGMEAANREAAREARKKKEARKPTKRVKTSGNISFEN